MLINNQKKNTPKDLRESTYDTSSNSGKKTIIMQNLNLFSDGKSAKRGSSNTKMILKKLHTTSKIKTKPYRSLNHKRCYPNSNEIHPQHPERKHIQLHKQKCSSNFLSHIQIQTSYKSMLSLKRSKRGKNYPRISEGYTRLPISSLYAQRNHNNLLH